MRLNMSYSHSLVFLSTVIVVSVKRDLINCFPVQKALAKNELHWLTYIYK